MSAIEIVVTILLDDTDVKGLVQKKIHPVVAPQNATRKYIVVNLVSEVDEQMLDGTAKYPESRVQVDCVANSATEANDLGKAVKAALENVTNEEIGEAVASVYPADTDFTDYDDARTVFRRVMDFYVRWR